MKMRNALVSTAAAAALLVGGAVGGSATVEDSSRVANGEGQVKDLDGGPPRTESVTPQDVVVEDGVTRVSGSNRYQTAAVIAEHYGWDFTNTLVVYIASGEDFPDALALGPSTFGDGPLLLVRNNSLPGPIQAMLEQLEPCYIDVVGGTEAVTDTVFDLLKQYANPAYCQE